MADGRWDALGVSTLNKNTTGTAVLSGSAVTFAGDVSVNAGTIRIDPEITFGGAPNVSVASGATLQTNSLTGFTNTHLDVDGILQLNGFTNWNSGNTITGSGRIVNEGNASFNADMNLNVAVFDWDQGVSTVQPDVHLNVDVTRIDTSNDTFNNNSIHVNSGHLAVNVADGQWDLGASGVLTLNQTTATIPSLSGSRLNVQSGGEVRATGGEVSITAPLTLQSGGNLVVQDPSRVNLDGPTTFAGGDITGSVGGVVVVQDGNLTVTGDSSVTVTTYDWDEGDTTIESTGFLDINVTNIDVVPGQKYDRTLTVNSGGVNVDTAGNVWTMDGTLNLNNSNNAVPVVGGDTMLVGDDVGVADAIVQVGGSGTSRISVPAFYRSDASVNVAAGTTLEHTSNVTFDGGGSYQGSGDMTFGANVSVTGPVTLDVRQVDLDPSGDTTGNTVSITAPLTLNVAELLSFGQSTVGSRHTIAVDQAAGGVLTVNSGTGAWTVNPLGTLDLSNDNTVATVLVGSDVNLQGEMNVTGDVRSTARFDIAGTVNIQTTDQPLRLAGGGLTDPNYLRGGTVSGNGILGAVSGTALHGHGTINTDVDFDGAARLMADDGTLLISGSIVDAGEVGTADTDGILQVTQPWSTSNSPINMAGGQITGSTITNNHASTGIRGRGTITARVVNTSTISANGGRLILSNSINDYTDPVGQLSAASGDLEIAGTTAPFAGQLTVSGGNEFFVNSSSGMGLAAASAVSLSSGHLRSTGNLTFAGGTISVSGSSESVISAEGVNKTLWFESGTNTTLNQNLRVAASLRTAIFSGANFSGGGSLVNDAGSQLDALAGANLGVTLVNEGVVNIAGVTQTGRVDMNDFVQASNGSLNMQLAGTLLTDFDRLIVSGAAQLDGTLDVQLLNGFMPDLGDTFPILSATGGLLGSFATELLPTLGNGLEFGLDYAGNQLILEVIAATSDGDFDGDGILDGGDADDLVAGIASGSNNPAFDLTGDGLVNADDLDQWLTIAGAANLPSGNPYLYGDASLDGFVDVTDFNAWNSSKFTNTAAWTMGDFNADGSIDVTDFNRWNSNKFTASDAATSTVPEPATATLLVMGLLLAVRRRS